VKLYHFIDCQKAEFKIKTLCRVCEVATSSYYTWASATAAGPADALWDEAILANRIYDVWARARGRYGAPRVTAQLWREGTAVNHKRVERIMTGLGLQGACGRRKLRTTVRDPGAAPAPDLVQRRFTSYRQDSLWIGDLTYIPTDEGWLYLATVVDTYSRRLLGWSLADHMRTELVADALRATGLIRGRCRYSDLIFHSDHGCQYTSGEYGKLCTLMGITQSMGTVGDSYDCDDLRVLPRSA